jgi:hypothetical protein
MSIASEIEALGHARVAKVREIGRREHISGVLLLAMAHRESNMRNIVGDAGHGRGIMQIDDRFHADWLKTHKGCRSGSFDATFDSALPPGRAPSLVAGVSKACDLLNENIAFAKSKGVPQGQRLRFAVAAYNGGAGNALKGFQAGDVDKLTTGADYSQDVLAHRAEVKRALGHAAPAHS